MLNVVRTGSTWTTEAAYWAGQAEDQLCEVCNEKELSDHIWTYKALADKRRQTDVELAEINLDWLHLAIKHGVAPAMKANPDGTF